MLHRLYTAGSGELEDRYLGPGLSPRGLTWTPRPLGAGVHALLATTPPKNNHGIVAGDRAALVIDACCWSAPPSLSAAAVDYDFHQPGAGHSYLAGLAARSHRSCILAAYRLLERGERAGRLAV